MRHLFGWSALLIALLAVSCGRSSDPVDTKTSRENYAKEMAPAYARLEYPEDTDIQWKILRTRQEDDLIFTELQPEPDDLDYPKYVLVISFKPPSKPPLVAVYGWESGRYVLLDNRSKNGENIPADLSW